MRALAQPDVLRNATIAAAVSALACLPRLNAWSTRVYPVWYLESVLFLGCIVLWGFVFGWHAKFTGKPAFTFRPDKVPLILATMAGLIGAVTQHFYLDPILRSRTPEDFPGNFEQWLSVLLFSSTLVDLLLVFAPFDWLLRLFRSPRIAAGLTVMFGLFVLWLKQRTLPQRLPMGFFALLVGSRIITGILSVYFYLKGGVLLVWWSHWLMQSRHLWPLHNS